ncbi:unnamed protein product [Rotaria socialis]|uniref:C2 domain-containing protein n=1 Tax=Rotaria socialis TaxID=392032 RepID=A0A820S3L8_9BILA|nr:unnamed protein product [Rotaria socialis]CAF3451217.1 unnamed protein product [Rotaria socialis]CAF3720313.1 unnamed protein product [Rotaria socialis]CAF4157399.1 unnamed protein product [Rotaria socialis]CAF4262020.1 unnamed protein product [Rotaria socialis]
MELSFFFAFKGGLSLNRTNNKFANMPDIMCITDTSFIIPRQIKDVRKELRPNFERAKRIILRMDECIVSSEEQNPTKQFYHHNISHGLHALAEAANKLKRFAFREVLSIDGILRIIRTDSNEEEEQEQEDTSVTRLFRHKENIDPIINFPITHNLVEFEQALAKYHMDLLEKPIHRAYDMVYLKFCLILEIQRDEYESCLRLLLHDIIFKFHLSDFHLRCEVHVRKPIEHELVLEKSMHESHLTTNYSAELILWPGDWIIQQEVELYVVIKIESLPINKYTSSKFWGMAHLHVKNIPHGASRIFLRELTPVSRSHKISTHDINIGQVEIEAAYWPSRQQLSLTIVRVNHLQSERLLIAPETYIEIVFQSPFDIYETKRTKVADRSFNPRFDEEFLFQIPETITFSDTTIDLIFLEKSSLHHHPVVLGVLTLSKHTDWFPVRKFWMDVAENPGIRLKDRFLFEGSIYD